MDRPPTPQTGCLQQGLGSRSRYSQGARVAGLQPPRIKPVVMVARDGDGGNLQSCQRVLKQFHVAIIPRAWGLAPRTGVNVIYQVAAENHQVELAFGRQ